MTVTAPTAPAVSPAHLHRLARIAEAAGWGPEGVMPGWLDEVAAEYAATAGRLCLMAAQARREQAADTLAGIGGR